MMLSNTARPLISRVTSKAIAAATASAAVSQSKRTIYTLPEMNNVNKDVGIPGLYSQQGLDVVWNKYQSHAAAEFNSRLVELSKESIEASELAEADEASQGMDTSNATAAAAAAKNGSFLDTTIRDILLASKVQEMDPTLVFHASQLYNNQFFVEGLFQRSKKIDTSAAPEALSANSIARATREELYRDVEIYNDSELVEEINVIEATSTSNTPSSTASSSSRASVSPFVESVVTSFGSVVSFKELLLAKAEAIFGDGYTWVVFDPRSQKLAVYNTYGSGTPPIFSNVELKATQDQSRYGGNSGAAATGGSQQQGLGPDSRFDFSMVDSYLVSHVVPVLNINVWQHAYLHDYGVFGKRRYLENVWNSVDWATVTKRFNKAVAEPQVNQVSHIYGTSAY